MLVLFVVFLVDFFVIVFVDFLAAFGRSSSSSPSNLASTLVFEPESLGELDFDAWVILLVAFTAEDRRTNGVKSAGAAAAGPVADAVVDIGGLRGVVARPGKMAMFFLRAMILDYGGCSGAPEVVWTYVGFSFSLVPGASQVGRA